MILSTLHSLILRFFNVADSFVCVGAGIMIVCLVIDLVKEIKLERAQKAEAANATEENDNDTDAK